MLWVLIIIKNLLKFVMLYPILKQYSWWILLMVSFIIYFYIKFVKKEHYPSWKESFDSGKFYALGHMRKEWSEIIKSERIQNSNLNWRVRVFARLIIFLIFLVIHRIINFFQLIIAIDIIVIWSIKLLFNRPINIFFIKSESTILNLFFVNPQLFMLKYIKLAIKLNKHDIRKNLYYFVLNSHFIISFGFSRRTINNCQYSTSVFSNLLHTLKLKTFLQTLMDIKIYVINPQISKYNWDSRNLGKMSLTTDEIKFFKSKLLSFLFINKKLMIILSFFIFIFAISYIFIFSILFYFTILWYAGI